MNKEKAVLKELEACKPGDLISVSWFDASVGKTSNSGGSIDVPVLSWGIFLGLIGSRMKHIILAQNSYRFLDGIYDLDYTAIPVGWALKVTCLQSGHLPEKVADDLVRCFAADTGGRRGNTSGLKSPRTSMHRRLRLSVDGCPY